MINKKNLETIKKEMHEFDSAREDIIKLSRDILKSSKKAIFSLHRDDVKSADLLIGSAEKTKSKIDSMLAKKDSLRSVGAFNEALQEYVEAVCYLNFIKEKELPSFSSVGVEIEDYMLGLCDLTGELVRKAINSSIKGDYKKAVSIKDFVAELYSVLMDFDFRSGSLRKKFDSIKYNLHALQDLVLKIKLK